MENQKDHTDLINTFCEIASSSGEEAQFFLESHNYDLDSAVSTYLETTATAAVDDNPGLLPPVIESPSPAATPSPSSSPSRSRSPSPPASLRGTSNRYNLRSREPMASSNNPSKKPSGSRPGGIRTLSDLNRPARDGSGSDSDEPQEYYTGGEKSGMLVQDPTRANDVDAIFRQAKQAGAVEGPPDSFRPSSSSRSFVGTGRLLSGETVSPAPAAAAAPQQPEVVTHNITFWSNGFTIDDGPLRRFDDPENAPFLESIKKSECPKELEPADRRTAVHVSLMRKEENCPVQVKPSVPFRGTGRTLGSSSSAEPSVDTTATTNSVLAGAPQPLVGLVVDPELPCTSIQLRLADGTRMVSRFNFHHTVRDIRGFIDASRPGGARAYHLQTVGFPPKQLTDLDQTIEQAGLANSVVIQKL